MANSLTKSSEFDEAIASFQADILSKEGSGEGDCLPLKHSFPEGMYVRELFIPAGTELVGKIHKHSHMNFLMSGEITVATESAGVQVLKGPMCWVGEAGCQRAGITHTDTWWINVHPNPSNTKDLEKIEEAVIVSKVKELPCRSKIKNLWRRVKKMCQVGSGQ